MAKGSMTKGMVACGHPATAEAALEVLDEGGNAIDAALAALCAATVAEPALTSLAGGGFLLAAGPELPPVAFDFFSQTPKRKRPPEELDFGPILADFGPAAQEFHVGLGAVATPGCLAGLLHVHERLGRRPLDRIFGPAIRLARDGVVVTAMQAFLYQILEPIFRYSESMRAVHAGAGGVPVAGETVRNPDLADTLTALGRDGARLYREGELGHAIIDPCRDGGHLDGDDLAGYQVVERAPLAIRHGAATLLTNPPPAAGGLLIGFALDLLADLDLGRSGAGSHDHLATLVRVMALTNKARIESGLGEDGPEDAARRFNDPAFVHRYRAEVLGRPATARGTTHISVIDGAGLAVSLTSSNGEGSGHIAPGTGIILNNMLGEEDLHPAGFHRWPADTRISSMMAPSILAEADGGLTALGSGGSNRLRTAILQVVLNLTDFGLAPAAAVAAPRVHWERDFLNVEAGFEPAVVAALVADHPDHKVWPAGNLFFGGVHVVTSHGTGAGDPRRAGVCRSL